MKVIIIIILGLLLLSSCSQNKTFKNGLTAEPYGLVNKDEIQLDTVVYEINTSDVLYGIIFCETVIVPIYIVGWDLYEPVRLKNEQDLTKTKYLKH